MFINFYYIRTSAKKMYMAQNTETRVDYDNSRHKTLLSLAKCLFCAFREKKHELGYTYFHKKMLLL